MSLETQHFYDFGDFRLDLAERVLLRDGKFIPVTPKVFETLCVLVENAGRIIEKEELMQSIWQERFVEESNLTFNVGMLRKALGDDASKPRYVETVPRRGYRFIAEVRTVEIEPEKRKEAEKVIGSLNDFPSFARSASLAPIDSFAASPKGAVVALADWRHEKEKKPPENAAGESADISTAPAKVIVKSRLQYQFLILAGLILTAIGFGYYFAPAKKTISDANDKKSIAVLPLQPVTAANRDEIYEMGIADSLIHQINSMKGFVVRPLSATRQYADHAQDPIAAGREQRVDYVLTANYQLADGKIRVTAQLYNAANGLIEDTYQSEKATGDIFAAQDAIAGEIKNSLAARFAMPPNSSAARRGTTNEEAYRLYLQGMYLVEKMTFADAKRSIERFNQALALDPNYAQAWAGKARAHCYFSHVGGDSPDVQYTQAKPAIERAFALDPNLPEAHAVLGVIKIDYDWDFAGGEKQFLRAIEIAPNSEIAYRWYANRLAGRGRSEEAIVQIKTAIDLNPNYVYNQILYGKTLYFARRYDEAILQLQRAGEMDSAHPGVYDLLWRSYSMKGDDRRAYESFIRLQQLFGAADETLRVYETAYTKGGWQTVLLKRLEIAKEKSVGSNAFHLAVLTALVNQPEQSFRYLDDAVNNRSAEIPNIASDPALDSLRGDSRFNELLKRAGLK